MLFIFPPCFFVWVFTTFCLFIGVAFMLFHLELSHFPMFLNASTIFWTKVLQSNPLTSAPILIYPGFMLLWVSSYCMALIEDFPFSYIHWKNRPVFWQNIKNGFENLVLVAITTAFFIILPLRHTTFTNKQVPTVKPNACSITGIGRADNPDKVPKTGWPVE